VTRRRRPARDVAVYILCRAALAGLALLPRRAGQAIGRCLGRAFYVASAARRRTALENLRRAFGPALDESGRARIARAAFAHVGMICADAAYFPRLARRPSAELAVYEGTEHLQAAAAQGRGVLVFSGHFGHWELVALLQHRLGVPMAMVIRPLDNPWFDAYLTRLRRLSGNTVLPKRNAARGVLRALRDRRAVALLIDQNVRGEGGVFVDFFGGPASTTPSLATFALKSGAPIVPVFSYPMRDGRLRISYRPALRAFRRGVLQDDIREVTRACTALLEEEVRRWPEFWFWMHGRWRTRPPSDAPPRAAAPGAAAQPPAVAGPPVTTAIRSGAGRSL
jgi:Kdo2-lipid IVA lauroyltransferase/acyltransferase